MDWTQLALAMDQWRGLSNTPMNVDSIRGGGWAGS